MKGGQVKMFKNNMNNYVEKYLSKVEEIQQTLPPLEERYNLIVTLNEEYRAEVGENLPSFLLEMLGTWYIQETYSDKRTNKASIEEFPILSESQLFRRGRKTVLIDQEDSLEVLNYHLRNNSSTSKNEKVGIMGGEANE